MGVSGGGQGPRREATGCARHLALAHAHRVDRAISRCTVLRSVQGGASPQQPQQPPPPPPALPARVARRKRTRA